MAEPTLSAGPDMPVISCVSIAQRARTQDWQFNPHRGADHHAVFWVSKGTGRVQINGITRGFGPNTAIFVPSDAVCGIEFGPGPTGWIISVPKTLPFPLDFPDSAIQATITRREEQSELISICDEINREQETARPGRETALFCQAGLLSVWIARRLCPHDPGLAQETKSDRLMRRFAHLIETRFATNDTASDYAAALGITPTHLSRICRDRYGKPATGVIQDRTLLEARRQLAFGDRRIADIATGLGFATPAYFTRLFTQKTGLSPSDFRRKSRKLPDRAFIDSLP